MSLSQKIFFSVVLVFYLSRTFTFKTWSETFTVSTAYRVCAVPSPSLAVHQRAFGSLRGPSLTAVLLPPDLSLCRFVVFYLFLDLHYGTEIKLLLVVHRKVNILRILPYKCLRANKEEQIIYVHFFYQVEPHKIGDILLFLYNFTFKPKILKRLWLYNYFKNQKFNHKNNLWQKRGKIFLIYMVIKYSL